MDEHIVESIAAMQINRETFLPYKNYCKGEKKIVICGAGPSLQHYIPIEDAIHIAVNRAFMYEKVAYDFIFAQDYEGINMVEDELINYRPEKCVKFLAQTESGEIKAIPESVAISCNAKRFICDYYMFGDGFLSRPVADIASRAIGGMPNVGMSVIQLALYMNPSELYIVGCDMTGTHHIKGNMSSHDLAREKNQYDKYWKNEYNRLINKWHEIKKFADKNYPNTRIISVNPVGLKGMFEDLYQKEEI